MRRKIDLYIGGELVDLSNQSLILMNWTQEDASNPTAIVAPYSQQVTLPGTPANNRIFGGIWRPDRITAVGGWTGAAFDALRKTPFTIYADTGEILESGYVRLDSVERKGPRVSYKCTLFGDTASFFYGLSYNDDGTAMSLADLNYTEAGGESELDFAITAAAVSSAWADLGTASDPLWRIINFAPAYEGIPDKDFDAEKGIADPLQIGLLDEKPEGADTYKTKGGKCLVNIPKAVDAWAAKDLRSYLQRPVINFGHVLHAIRSKAADLGYTLDLSTLDRYIGDYWVDESDEASRLWLTLPLLSTLSPSPITGAAITKSQSAGSSNPVAVWDITGTIPTGTKISVMVSTELRFTANTVPMPVMTKIVGNATDAAIFFLRLTGWKNGTQVCASKILPANMVPGITPLSAYNILGGTDPYTDEDFYAPAVYGMPLTAVSATQVKTTSLSLQLEGYDFDEVHLEIVRYGVIRWVMNYGTYVAVGFTGTFGIPYIKGFEDYGLATASIASLAGANSDTVSFDAPNSVRSGALITKRALLGGTKTPAQYLISFAKSFGLLFAVDKATKTVTLCKRGEYYDRPSDVVDLTGRVDLGSVTLKPAAVDAKWYEFKADVKGEFETEYESLYGTTYGSQKVNTGYQFNDDTKAIISNSVLRGAVTALERSKYFNYIVGNDTVFRPSLFLDEGVTYSLWTTAGKSLDIPVQTPASGDVTITYYNNTYNGYDVPQARKLQLHDASGKGVAGEDILVFYVATYPKIKYPYFKVTDDDALMANITGGKGCWDIGPGASAGIFVPSFQRIAWRAGGQTANSSLDFGMPREFAFPGETLDVGSDVFLYDRAWKAYLHDRYDGNTKVMTCKVDLAGLRVDADLLRRFYWFEGAVWVLNKISNYAVTAFAPTQCEFVQVQDIDAYNNGQNFE